MKTPIWYGDYIRTTDSRTFYLSHFLRDYVFHHNVRYMVWFRKAQHSRFKLFKLFCNLYLYVIGKKYGIEIKPQTQIGTGLKMIHPYNITVSPYAKLGKNIDILKGATVGISHGGSRPGAPTIGDCVYIGINSTIVGGITIGDDVLIAPNTLVNIDVPSHSVVIGNPCRIIHRENATDEYIFNKQ